VKFQGKLMCVATHANHEPPVYMQVQLLQLSQGL
jgi:hypothetical protein